jgi:hypothetical protein
MKLHRALCAAASCLLVTGCRDIVHNPTVWRRNIASTDGQWLATARTDQWGGFGTAWVETTVSLRKPNKTVNRGKAFDIFSFPGERGIHKAYTLTDENASRDIRLNWLSPKHLEIDYASDVQPDLAVIRFSDVDITYRAVPPPQ